MKDRNGNILILECKLRSELFGKREVTIIYKGDDTFECPGGGHIYHNQKSLLDSHWAVSEYPKKGNKLTITCEICK